MMKKIFTLATSIALAAGASAQSYDEMWTQVQHNAEKDLPQSAADGVKEIRDKAITENNNVQLLRAILMLRVYSAEVSPDSADVYVKHIEQALSTEQDEVMKALYHSALAQCYESDYDDDNISHAANKKQMQSHFEASLVNLDALASARVQQYLPLIEYADDSKFFNNDLLHVVLDAYLKKGNLRQQQKVDLLTRVIDFYTHRNALNAATLLSLQRYELMGWHAIKQPIEQHQDFITLTALLQKEQELAPEVALKVYEELTNLQSHYQSDKPYAAHNDSVLVAWAERGIQAYGKDDKKKDFACNPLRNFMLSMTTPEAQLSGMKKTYATGQVGQFSLKLRNLKEVKIRLLRLFDSQLDYKKHSLGQVEELARRRSQKAIVEVEKSFTPSTPYAWLNDSISLPMPSQPGVYYIDMKGNGKNLKGCVVCVSDYASIRLSTRANGSRVTVVNRTTGQPVPNALITAYGGEYDRRNKWQQMHVYKTNEKGQVNIAPPTRLIDFEHGITVGNDAASEFFTVEKVYGYDEERTQNETRVQLYTDRGIYRPGQQIDFTGTAFTHEGDNYRVVGNYKATIELRNVNNKVIDSLAISTDAMGSFSGSFTLPKEGITGNYSLRLTQCSAFASKSIRVEAYKRPTFTATTKPVTVAYALGDTVNVEGEAKTYSGVSVPHARVQYTVRRSAWFFWNDDEFEPQSGEVTTDDEGRFSLPVFLAKANDFEHEGSYNRYTYTVDYTVTAENGETTQGSHALTLATRPTWLTANVPNTICRRAGKALPTFTITQVNASGEPMTTQGTYQLLRQGAVVAEGVFEGGKAFTLQALQSIPSATYELRYKTAEAAEEALSFVLFSDTDKQPASATNALFCYKEADPKTGAVDMIVGSPCENAILYYDIIANGRIVESKQFTLNNELRTFHIDYQPSYGDGAKVAVALFRNGQLYSDEAEVIKPLPDKQLILTWKTFRSRLTPGQQEEWVLQVTRPDGTPAKAQLAACMYDASLDAFTPNRWNDFDVSFSRRLPLLYWRSSAYNEPNQIQGCLASNSLPTLPLSFSHWNNELFNYFFLQRYSHVLCEAAPSGARMARMRSMSLDANAVDARMYKTADTDGAVAPLEPMAAMGGTNPQPVVPRTNFAETAFFRPNLRTNAEGEVSIAFTLPESMTQWNFCALAHTQRMDYGRIDTTVVARKEFMVEPALPRFLRRGDKTELPVKVTNLSDKTVKAQLQLTLTDALSNQQQYNASQKITLAAGESKVFNFVYDASQAEGVLVCRATAQGNGFSDGEEHYLPILTTDVEVTRTLPFSLTQKGTTSLTTDTLFNAANATHRSLSVELSSNPTWYAVTALPALAGSTACLNAIDWATRYYAFTIGQYVAQCNPEIKRLAQANGQEAERLAQLKTEGLTDATPWLQHAEAEKTKATALRQMFDNEVAAAQLYTAIDKMRALQNAGGAFCWYPGMEGNAWITMEVALLLARTEHLTQQHDHRAHTLLQSSFDFLRKDVAHDVQKMKEDEKKLKTKLAPSEYCMRYLYLRTLMKLPLDDDAQFLVNRAADLHHEFTMYGKALSAIIFAQSGKKAEAELALKSLLEHTVSQPEMGRYFDTQRAQWSWQSYRIPTQCAAIEALRYFNNDVTANEMRLWLLQAKRTQMWETARATSDAVYTLLMSNDTTTVMPLAEQTPVYYTLYNNKQIVGTNAQSDSETPTTVGYVKQTYTDKTAVDATSLKVDKRTDGLSWGAVYATFMVPIDEVTTHSNGLQLTRRLERLVGTEWQTLTNTDLLQKGDRVRQVYSIVADRDYDFVALKSDRPANMEPVSPLSGYAWNTDLPAYRAVHDASTDYFIEHLRKGKHQFAEEFFIDRTGHFANGVAHIQCVYAPEFQGITK